MQYRRQKLMYLGQVPKVLHGYCSALRETLLAHMLCTNTASPVGKLAPAVDRNVDENPPSSLMGDVQPNRLHPYYNILQYYTLIVSL